MGWEEVKVTRHEDDTYWNEIEHYLSGQALQGLLANPNRQFIRASAAQQAADHGRELMEILRERQKK